MGLKYTKRAMTSYEVHRFFHGLEISFFPDTFLIIVAFTYEGHYSKNKRNDYSDNPAYHRKM